MNSKLSPEVLEQLKLEATKYATRNNVSWAHREWKNCEADYLAGAIAEREKAMELVESAQRYLLSRAVVGKELDWDSFEAFKSAVEKYLGKAKE